MLVLSKFLGIAISAVFLFPIAGKMSPSRVSLPSETSSSGQPISLVIWTDQTKYSLRGVVKLNASLQNNGDARIYFDRRMFWTGFGGGLKLEISDKAGQPLPAQVLSDAIMPPPREGDSSILVPLDEGFFTGPQSIF